ncbi:MAG: NUDIX domain-containing protein [Acidimicrobiales bacterium]
MVTSAGVLLYRVTGDHVLEVLVAHMGGPFWAHKDDGAWSIPKGEYADGEDPFAVAVREFEEELGQPPPVTPDLDLGEIRQPSGKRVRVWAGEGDCDVRTVVSNTFEMEWPKGSGELRKFPEVDRAEWMSVARARVKLLKGQAPLLDRLLDAVRTVHTAVSEGPPSERSHQPPPR